MITILDLKAEFAKLTLLRGRTPQMTEVERKGSGGFATLAPFRERSQRRSCQTPSRKSGAEFAPTAEVAGPSSPPTGGPPGQCRTGDACFTASPGVLIPAPRAARVIRALDDRVAARPAIRDVP